MRNFRRNIFSSEIESGGVSGTSYQLQNGGQSDATYSYREPGTNTLISTFLGGFETTTICAVNGSVSAESAINVSELGSC